MAAIWEEYLTWAKEDLRRHERETELFLAWVSEQEAKGRPESELIFGNFVRERYRRKTWVYVHKSENAIGKQYFIVQKAMRDKIPEARPCTLLTVVDRAGMPRLWPLMSPRPGENDNTAWATSRDAARDGLTCWTKSVWHGRQFISRFADPGYAPDPDWSRLPPFDELVRTGLGPDGIIRDEQNRAYRAMFGKVDQPSDLDVDEIDGEGDGGDGPEDALR